MSTPTGIIDFAFHPPLGLLGNHLDENGPYGPGSHTLDHFTNGGVDVPVDATFGILTIPYGAVAPELGVTLGWRPEIDSHFDGDIYQDRVLQVVVQHQLALGFGGWVRTQILNQYTFAAVLLWEEALPGRIGLYVAPNWTFDIQFLRVP